MAIAGLYAAHPALTLACLLVATVTGLLQPAFVLATGRLVQAVASGQAVELPLALLAAAFVAARLLGPLRDQVAIALWRRVDQAMGDRIMLALSGSPGLQHIEDPRVQDRVAQAEGAVSGYNVGQAALALALLWPQRLFGLISLLIVFQVYWWAGLGLAAVHALGYALTRWHLYEVTVVMYGRTDQLRRAFYLRGLALSARMAKETRVFGLARWLVDRYRDSALRVLHEVWGRRDEGWLIGVGAAIVVSGAEGLVLWTLANDSLQGRIGLGTAVATTQAVLATSFLSVYQDNDWTVSQAAASMGRVIDLERTVRASSVAMPGRRAADGLPRAAIRFEGVHFTYPGRAQPVFDDFNLEIEAGRSLAIVGDNGAGKTTLVKLLTRLYDPSAGRITVDGIDLRELDPTAWHRRLAAVFQDFATFELSAYDNVAFGALHAADDAPLVARAASLAGAQPIVERLERGWATPLSRELRHGTQLSGGEWQRLALARALFGVLAGAGVLILDEPTAALDVRGEAEVYQRFLELTRGVTTLVISHRFSTVRRADRIVVIDHGQVVEDGSHAALIARGGRYASLYGLQAARFG